MGSIALNLRVSGWMSSMGAPVELGETWQVSGWFDAWIAVRGCDERGGRARPGRSLLAPTQVAKR